MAEFICYHNPDSMGYPASEVRKYEIVTDKPVKNAMGSRVWLLTGEGHPRSFKLRGYFYVTDIEDAKEDGFETRLKGAEGRLFDPMLSLNDEEWFPALKKSQGNFAFGLQPLGEARFVRGLEELVANTK